MATELRQKILEVSQNLSESTNKDLIGCMELLKQDFEQTKSNIIHLTKHLEGVEFVYNKILKEYESRINGK
jgi:hypothetical protein